MRSDSDEEKTARLLARPKYEEDMQPSGPAPRHVEKPSLSPVQEEATPTERVTFVELAKLLGVDTFFSDSEDGRTSVPSDGINRLRDTLSRLEKSLAGSISERETLTAHRVDMEAQIDALMQDWDKAKKAVDSLITERDKFQDWFQNAEQARAVAIAERDRQSERAAQFERDLEVSEVQRAELLHSREQAIQDIEALPCYQSSPFKQIPFGTVSSFVARSAVLSIVRGSAK